MKEFWDLRYASDEFAYGKLPNRFIKDTLDELQLKGKIIFPAEGEGRNAVYAAKLGLNVFAFDTSVEGKKKALLLAEEENVSIEYNIIDMNDLDLPKESFDAAVLVYAHFPPHLRRIFHRKIGDLVKPGGHLIIHGFSKENYVLRQSNPLVGGPNDMNMLFSIEELITDFNEFEVSNFKQSMVLLNEGHFHKAESSVISLIAKKNK